MRYKNKLITIVLLILMLTAIQYAFPAHSKLVTFYNSYIFHPFQQFRNWLFSLFPVSIGDLIYIVGGIGLVGLVVKWLRHTIRFREEKHELGSSMLKTLIVTGLLYVFFILGWGGNYYKSSLASFWQLNNTDWSKDTTLYSFDEFLIGKLNEYAPQYQPANFKTIDKKARAYFHEHTDSRTKDYGIKVKPSVFGFAMQHLGIQGYYNPFTGEAQVNKHLPAFMLPFVVCHEMAHQSGIAREDDANLLSYAVSTMTEDPLFHYSAYLNLWLYTHARLRRVDTTKANELRSRLNPITIAHLDTLKMIRRKYASGISEYSGALYDGYLKLHHQKDGIESYNKVAISAWALEEKRKTGKEEVIQLP